MKVYGRHKLYRSLTFKSTQVLCFALSKAHCLTSRPLPNREENALVLSALSESSLLIEWREKGSTITFQFLVFQLPEPVLLLQTQRKTSRFDAAQSQDSEAYDRRE